MGATLFTNATVLDTPHGRLWPDRSVLVRDGRIAEVADGSIKAEDADTVDLSGHVLMPGLCDGHVHVTAITPDFAMLGRLSPFYVGARAHDVMREMLMRGFTTVRDAGGADHGLARAVEEGSITGPRVLFCGRALSQTGGHGDMRMPGEGDPDGCFCCAGLGRVCDGVPEVRRAVRDEIRKGAHHIKIMASGGIASPTDRIDSTQFALEEIDAVVEETEAANIYVAAHAYTARAIKRLIGRGVRTIEHGNLLDAETCRMFLNHRAYLVPTLSTYRALADEGVAAGLPGDMAEKIDAVLEAGHRAMELAYRQGVKLVFGTDLLGSMHRHQLNEINLRKDVVSPADLIRSATCTAAEAFQAAGDFGVVEAGARADLLVVDGNPLDDITLLTRPETSLLAVMKAGQFFKRAL